MVADAAGVLLECKEYLSPIVTPWEAALAFSGRQLALPAYRLDMRAALVGRHAPHTTHHAPHIMHHTAPRHQCAVLPYRA